VSNPCFPVHRARTCSAVKHKHLTVRHRLNTAAMHSGNSDYHLRSQGDIVFSCVRLCLFVCLFVCLFLCQHDSSRTAIVEISSRNFLGIVQQSKRRSSSKTRREVRGWRFKGAYRPFLKYAVIGSKLKQNANEGCNSCATVVQVLQDLFYVLLHVLFYL